MQFQTVDIPGLVVIQPAVFGDERGFFYESYRKEHFVEHGIDAEFVQDNHSKSQKNTLRGLHFQIPPHEQAKLVRVTRGRAYDVAVDIRKNSPTYGKWFGIELSAENKTMFFVPVGFAHGFLALEDGTEFLYKVTNVWAPEHEGGIRYDDPDLSIPWQLSGAAIQNQRDANFPLLKDLNSPFVL
ncbi:MAG: dTDP-4-dehydrorhamnose 3,5-epimerase [Candidatus Kerfeldbacteria bacterium]|nr:dTDP-4-dehydrorhamnose 3,5-epimerase [Candidatus Kerfeldbacteria bacterium]